MLLLTGLAPNTTYYFLVIGTTNAGLQNEGLLYGQVLSFSTPLAERGTGSIVGTVWIGTDEDDIYDSKNERDISGVPISGSGGLTSITTGNDGTFEFVGLAPGTHTITAVVDAVGFEYTFDTDEGTDWSVEVVVTADAISTADFAGIGQKNISGEVIDEADTPVPVPVPGAYVICFWMSAAGDGAFEPVERDIGWIVTADDDGVFQMPTVPFGGHICAAPDDYGDPIPI